MSQPYPDPPVSSPLMEGKTPFMAIIWWKWIQGLRVLVNRLAVGQDVNGTFTTVDGKTVTITNGVVKSIV